MAVEMQASEAVQLMRATLDDLLHEASDLADMIANLVQEKCESCT